MKEFSIAYLPIGVPTFDLECAQSQFEQSVTLLRQISERVVAPEKMLLSIGDLSDFLDTIQPDAVVIQNITFANSAYPSEILRRCNCPVLLWTLSEPVVDGARLRLNSLTGAYSAANALHAFGRGKFTYVFGGPQEAETEDGIKAFVDAAKVYHKMHSLKMAAIGHTPQGFGFGRGLDSELVAKFGVRLEAIEVRELLDKAKSYTEDDLAPYLQETKENTVGLDKTPEKNKMDHSRVFKAYADYVEENQIGAVASRCWPDFFTAFGTPVCTVLSMLNQRGIAASCEADVYGALSMYVAMQLTGSPVFFGDPVHLDKKAGTITYWHCGACAPSLAQCSTGATVGVHPNRKIGPAMDFACEGGQEVTIFRIGRNPDGSVRFFVSTGQSLNVPKQFIGTSIVVETTTSAQTVVEQSVQDGWEPHFVVLSGNCVKALEQLAKMYDAEFCQY